MTEDTARAPVAVRTDTLDRKNLNDAPSPLIYVLPQAADTFKFFIGSSPSGVTGGIIRESNGTLEFVGYWGADVFPNGQNSSYKEKDPITGDVWVHWISSDPATGEMYHYIYDPERDLLKIFHKLPDGTVVWIYFGPPIQDPAKLVPPDPAPGAGYFTNESQFGGTGGTGTLGGGTGGTLGSDASEGLDGR